MFGYMIAALKNKNFALTPQYPSIGPIVLVSTGKHDFFFAPLFSN